MKITFETLLLIKPELDAIRQEAKDWSLRDDRWEFYESLKARMCDCVGMTAAEGLPRFMYSIEAYDVAHQMIFKDNPIYMQYDEE